MALKVTNFVTDGSENYKPRRIRVIDGVAVEESDVLVHEFTVGDTEDPDLIAGFSRLILYDYNLDKAYQSTGYGKYHSTNACMAWKKAYLKTNSHDETKTFAEEQSFTKSFTEKLIQLEPLSTIVASSHNLNTFNKKKLLVSTYINNNVLKEMSKTVDKLIDEKYLNRYKKIFVNKIVNLYDIVVFCGGFNKQLEPEVINEYISFGFWKTLEL